MISHDQFALWLTIIISYKKMTTVTGYVFESINRKRARAFNFFNQMWDEKFVKVVVNGVTQYLLQSDNEDCMRTLCQLLDEAPKVLVTVDATEVEDIGF